MSAENPPEQPLAEALGLASLKEQMVAMFQEEGTARLCPVETEDGQIKWERRDWVPYTEGSDK